MARLPEVKNERLTPTGYILALCNAGRSSWAAPPPWAHSAPMIASTSPSSASAAAGATTSRFIAKLPNARVAAVCDIEPGTDRARRRPCRKSAGIQTKSLRGPAQALRRQRHRRRLHRHAQPLARAGHHLGLPGRQGRLRRKARLPQHLRRPADGGGRAQVQPHGAGRHRRAAACRTRSARCNCCRTARSARSIMAKGLCFKRRNSIGHTPGRARACRASIGTLSSGPAPMRPFNKQPLQLQLALVLGHRQRRHRQPGHPRDGHRALGPGRVALPKQRGLHRRQVRLRRRPGDAQHADRHASITATPSCCSRCAA